MTDLLNQFRAAMKQAGLIPPARIVADGKIHRCDTLGGVRSKGDGSYILYPGEHPSGGFQNWRDSIGWRDWAGTLDHQPTAAESAKIKAYIDETRRKAEAEAVKRHSAARDEAKTIWDRARPCTSHPYLKRKRIDSHGARTKGPEIIIPLHDEAGKLHSLQFISVDGTKRFLLGGRVAGNFFIVGDLTADGPLCIVEGFATGASIHEATGYAVVVCFNSGNLPTVAVALRRKYTDQKIVVCADDDVATDGNPGITKATEAARMIGAVVAIPDFGDARPDKATDFNDLANHLGPEAVLHRIDDALADTPLPMDDRAEIARLATLGKLAYEREREAAAKRLRVRISALDNEVGAVRNTRAEASGDGEMFPKVATWHEPVGPAALLDEIYQIIGRFIVCSEESRAAMVLWIAFTWLIDKVQTAPLLFISSPEKRCGKTQALILVSRMVYRPLLASNITPAATFRTIEAYSPTLAIDEADSFARENEELRGVLNSGHSRPSAFVIRTVGDDHEPKRFSTWGAKLIAGIGHLAETIMDRSITITLRRKLAHEAVEKLRYVEPGLFDRLSSMLARFAADAGVAIEAARPALPEELNDRAADNWEPLLAIADYAGGRWPTTARAAAVALSGTDQEPLSTAAELLGDIRDIFDSKEVDRLGTAELLETLVSDDEKPWATYNRGKPFSPRQLAKRLGDYGIKSANIRPRQGGVKKGFHRWQFEDAFARYLAQATLETAATPLQNDQKLSTATGYPVAGKAVVPLHAVKAATLPQHKRAATRKTPDPAPKEGGRSATRTQSATAKPLKSKDCSVVADKSTGANGNKPNGRARKF